MDINGFQPIPNEAILFHKGKKILVVADLHIGIESELRERGLQLSSQAKKMINHLLSICDEYKPKDIVLLGDIKHNIPSAFIQERRDVRKFLRIISGYGNVHVVPGNHDGFIHKLSTEEINVHPSDGLIFENVGFAHGHRWPSNDIMECELVIVAHTHPTVMLKDRLEYRTFEPCWIKVHFLRDKLMEKYPDSKNPRLLVMPAFNPLCGGIAVNKDGIAGPLGKIIDIKNASVYLEDGTFLDKVKELD